jgi:hypothetical protein
MTMDEGQAPIALASEKLQLDLELVVPSKKYTFFFSCSR